MAGSYFNYNFEEIQDSNVSSKLLMDIYFQ